MKRLCRQRWINRHREIGGADTRDGDNVANEIERKAGVERLVDRVCEQRKQQRVTVRRRLRDEFGTDIAASARPVIDDDGLAEPIGEPLRHDAGENIGATASGQRDDDAHGA
ncbi:MAG: hypothetical protein WA268_11530 [Xanthobacteraceae bacterium]